MAMRWNLSSAPVDLMAKRLLYTVLLLASVAMLLLVVGFGFWKIGLGLIGGLLYTLAGKLMLLTFSLLIAIGVLSLLLAVWRELRRYFSREASALRKLLSVGLRAENARQFVAEQTRQLRYRSLRQRQAALRADDRQQLRSLYRAIDAELQTAKSRMPRQDYQQLRKLLRQSLRQADTAAMLTLREQLPCR